MPTTEEILNEQPKKTLTTSEILNEKRGIWKFSCRAEVNGELACSATILCADRKI